jgi:exonuclease VII small subunit
LNFSEFKTYEKRKADHKLEELVEVLEAGEMPLKSYLLMHGDAKVTAEETQLIKTWVKSLGVAVE